MSNRVSIAAAVVLALIGIAIMAAPAVCGWWIGQQLHALYARSSQAALHAEITDYRRGWLSSEARARISIPAGDGLDSVELVHRIHHGPLISGWALADIRTTLAPGSALKSSLRSLFGDAEPLSISMRVGLNGDIRGVVDSPAVTASLEDHLLQWQGLWGVYNFDRAGSFAVDLHAAGLALTREEAAPFRVADIGASFRGALSPSGLVLGDGAIGIGQLSAPVAANAPAISLSGLKITANSSEADGAVDSNIDYAVDAIDAFGHQLRKFKLDLSLLDLDAAALKAYADAVHTSMEQTHGDPSAATTALAGTVMQLAPRILARNPAIAINELSVGFDGQPLHFDGIVRYVGNASMESFKPQKDLEGHAHLEVPRQLVLTAMHARVRPQAQAMAALASDTINDASIDAQTDILSAQMLDGFIAQGLLVPSAEALKAELKLEGGAATLNGRVYPLFGFAQ